MKLGLTALLLLTLIACASTPPRPASSTYGCIKTVVTALPVALPDPERHCLASAAIVRRCSRFEAWLAGWGKEIGDVIGPGDASWQDLAADRAGRRCASAGDAPDALLECCRQVLTPQPARHR